MLKNCYKGLGGYQTPICSPPITPGKFIALTVILLLLWPTACTRSKMRKELRLNEYFAEILKREDRRELGDDGFFPSNLLDNPYPEVREWCAVALGRIGAPESLPWLYEALHSEYASVRAASAFAIGEIEDRELVQAQSRLPDHRARTELIHRLEDPSAAVRMRVVEALGKIGGSVEAVEIVRRLERFNFRGSIPERMFLGDSITAMARIKDPIVIPVLEKLGQIMDAEIRQRARDALALLKFEQEIPSGSEPMKNIHPGAQGNSTELLNAAKFSSSPADPEPTGQEKKNHSLYPIITDTIAYALAADRKNSTIAILDTTQGIIEIELFREQAPATSHRFILEARGGRFTGMEFVREEPNIVSLRRSGSPIFPWPVRSEINMVPFGRGNLGMVISGEDSRVDSFFITLAPQPFLDGVHTCFGRVISGIQVAEKIAAGDRLRQIRIKTYPGLTARPTH